LGFYFGQHLEQQNEQPKADWPEGTTKAYAGCSRIIATIQRASSTELPAESGEKRRRGCSGEGQAVFVRPNSKKTPIFIDSKPTSENWEGLPHDLRDHLGGVGGTRGRIHKTSCSVVISARRE
jgi:hypothetical protein